MSDGVELAVRGAHTLGMPGACHRLAREAEDAVRQGREGAVGWGGYRLATHFQPIFHVRAAKVFGYEALARAEDGALGAQVPPAQVFADAHGGDRVRLDWICRALHLRNFAIVDHGDHVLFLNVHPEAVLNDARCATEFGGLVRYYGLSPSRVCVEILEKHCTDEGVLREAVAVYRDLGVTIAMDEFGVGGSNFDRIASLRPDIVKIDRALLVSAVGQDKARDALPVLVRLLRDSGAKVAAQGIESADQALLALDSGADYLQGSYFARPRPSLVDEAFSERILQELLRMRGGRSAARALVG